MNNGIFAVDVSPIDRTGFDAISQPKTITLPDGTFAAPEPAVSAKDIRLLAALPVMTAIAWSCSDSFCSKLCRGLTARLRRLRPQRYEEFVQIFRDFLPEGLGAEARDALAMETAALHHLERLQLLRYHRPGSWRPKIELAGKEHLESALARGKGAILWVTFATFSDMISKVALREQGYDVWHLSRHNHGHFSSTRFGIRFLNPIRIAVERRYLADRVVIDPAEPRAAMTRLEQLLADNRVVSITVGGEARRVTLVPFGKGHLSLAGGAPNLAVKCGAALLPVFTERRADGSFLVTIEAPLDPAANLDRNQKIVDLIVRESLLLRRYFERLPEQFNYHDLHCDRRCGDTALKTEAGRKGSEN